MSLHIQEHIPLSNYTTLKTGGVARFFARVESVEELKAAAHFAKQNALPLLVLGGGSNMLISDTGFPGLVLQVAIAGRLYKDLGEKRVSLWCGAGEVLDDVVADTVSRGYFGLENLSSIPGSVGATPVQNVGAYGVEVSELIESVEVFDMNTNEVISLSNFACAFSYRDSLFKKSEGEKYVITRVHFILHTTATPKLAYADLQKKFGSDATPSLREVREAIIAIRSEKFPDWHVLGTAGSFFKNPIITPAAAAELVAKYPLTPHYDTEDGMVKISLGYVLDKVCGLKGYRVGNVGLYEAQALVLVNYGGATTDEIKKFAADVAAIVFEKTTITISPEVRFIE